MTEWETELQERTDFFSVDWPLGTRTEARRGRRRKREAEADAEEYAGVCRCSAMELVSAWTDPNTGSGRAPTPPTQREKLQRFAQAPLTGCFRSPNFRAPGSADHTKSSFS